MGAEGTYGAQRTPANHYGIIRRSTVVCRRGSAQEFLGRRAEISSLDRAMNPFQNGCGIVAMFTATLGIIGALLIS